MQEGKENWLRCFRDGSKRGFSAHAGLEEKGGLCRRFLFFFCVCDLYRDEGRRDGMDGAVCRFHQ